MVGKKPITAPTPAPTPSTSSDCATGLRSHASQPAASASRAASTPVLTRSESAAPTKLNVSTNTAAMMAKKHGIPVKRPVRSLSTETLRLCSRLSCGRTTVLSHRFARKAKRMLASAASASMPASASMAAVSSRTDETADSGRSSLRAISSSPSTIFVAAKRAGTDACSAYGSMMCAVAWMQRCTAPSGSCSCALAGQKSMRPGASSKRATCRAWSTSSSTPSFFAAEMGTTGMPSSASSSFTRTVPPLASTSSIMLSASTMGIPSSMICMVRYRLRSILVPSTMLMMPSGFSSSRKSRVTISSLEYGDSEYTPGRSVTVASACPRMAPSLRSTVTPGKLPTCWFAPVSWLNSVVLPQFWLPTNAKVSGPVFAAARRAWAR